MALAVLLSASVLPTKGLLQSLRQSLQCGVLQSIARSIPPTLPLLLLPPFFALPPPSPRENPSPWASGTVWAIWRCCWRRTFPSCCDPAPPSKKYARFLEFASALSSSPREFHPHPPSSPPPTGPKLPRFFAGTDGTPPPNRSPRCPEEGVFPRNVA